MRACERHQQWWWSDKVAFTLTAIKSLEITEARSCWFLVGISSLTLVVVALVLICIKLSSVLAALATVTVASVAGNHQLLQKMNIWLFCCTVWNNSCSSKMTNLTMSMKDGNVIGYSSLQMVTYSQAGPKCQEVATTSIVSTSGKTTADRMCLAPRYWTQKRHV